MFDPLKAMLRKRAVRAFARESVRDPWPFDQPPNCATLTMRQVLEGAEPILLVSHTADDGGWQFTGHTDASVADARVVGLREMVELDPSILQVADLPLGWQAVRRGPGYPWQRRRRPPEDATPD